MMIVKKKIQTPRIRFISEGKAAKPFYLSKMINVYAECYSPESSGILEIYNNLIR